VADLRRAAALLAASAAAAVALAGCASPITSGLVPGKQYDPAHYETYLLPVSTGKTTILDLETVTDDEARAWGLVFYGPGEAPKAWFEPAASVLDPYRMPNVVHLRLFLDKAGRPFTPRGEPYHIRPWADGSSPRKITEGRLGADVR
jgi:hypothetical protein